MRLENQFLLLLIFGSIFRVGNFQTHSGLMTFESAALRGVCTLRCSDEPCLTNCLNTSKEIGTRDVQADANPTLICRDVTFITLAHNPGTFVIEHRFTDNEDYQWHGVFISIGSRTTISRLSSGTSYQFRFHRVFEDSISIPEITGGIDTMPDFYTPSKVQNISLPKFKVEAEDPFHLEAEISFIPNEDRSCYYEVICQDSINRNTLFELEKPVEFNVTFVGLTLGTEYTVSVTARTKRRIDSDKTYMTFTTPTCLDVYANLTICKPDKVKGLNATATHKMGNIFDVKVTWKRPKLIPDSYELWLYPISEDAKDPERRNVSGTMTEAVFSNVEIVQQFRLNIRARSRAGPGTTIFVYLTIPDGTYPPIATSMTFATRQFPRPSLPKIFDILIPCLGGTILVVIGTGFGVYKYIRIRRSRLTHKVDEYEISPNRLVITRVLGNGAFGVVKLGMLRDDQGRCIDVAVKMLRDDSNKDHTRSFQLEIKMMKALDKHPNLVSMLGCCTIGPYPFLVLEYCSRGDLHSFLRKSLVETMVPNDETEKRVVADQRLPKREEVIVPQEESSQHGFSKESSDGYVDSSVSAEDQDTNCDSQVVTILDMLNFGRQIAKGMEFLSSNKIVHRDLAARNILVCDDRTVKISDFGLSRDVCGENIYKKCGNGRMPLKWMAIESLTHQIYSIHSDVWSFGVLLWEIMTLGGDPYPGIPTIEILKQLQTGYRMEKPENCSVPLYNVMLSCWQRKPKDRPAFDALLQELDKLISAVAENTYLDFYGVSEEIPIEADDVVC